MSAYNDTEGSAWTWHKVRQQWYYHKFHDSQPDLNLRNEEIIKELMVIYLIYNNKLYFSIFLNLKSSYQSKFKNKMKIEKNTEQNKKLEYKILVFLEHVVIF